MRLFLACPIPKASPYKRVSDELVQGFDGKPAMQPHITVAFLGEADHKKVKEVLEGFEGSRLSCKVKGVGAFPDPEAATVAWAGVQCPGLEALANHVRDWTWDLAQNPDNRPYVPHVTLARLPEKTDLSAVVTRHKSTKFWEGELEELALYASHLHPTGAAHQKLASWPLS